MPKRRVPGHAKALRDVPYKEWAALSQAIHGGELDACGVCGKMPENARHCDRDHEHDSRSPNYGQPRGLACGGDFGCNRMMPRTLNAEKARGIAYLLSGPVSSLANDFSPYLPRDMTPERAEQIADYLERYEAHYEAVRAAVSA